jgi:hypothetical protein
MRPPGSQPARLQPLEESRVLVTHFGVPASCCAGGRDGPSATAGHARNFQPRGSNPGSPADPAIASGWPPSRPGGNPASSSSAGVRNCGDHCDTLLCNAGTWAWSSNSSADRRTTRRHRTCTPRARKQIPPPAPRKKTGKKTQEEDAGRRVLSEALEEDAP